MDQSQIPNLPSGTYPISNSTNDINSDLGLGRVIAQQSRGRFINKDGSLNSIRLGMGWWASLSPYHWLLTISWPAFFVLISVAYLLLNLLFAFLFYLCGPNAIQGSTDGILSIPFWRSFFFSVETFSTIGYGHVAPIGLIANLLMTLESFLGLVAVALTTGILFARFARPVTRVIFSRKALIAPFQDGQAFMFRIANGMRNDLVDLNVQLTLSRFEVVNGQRVRRFYPLSLERSHVALFPLAWTIVHPIDTGSPLWGLNQQDLLDSDAEFLVILSGIDDTVFQSVYTRSSYKPDEIVWNARFGNMYVPNFPIGPAIDMNKLHHYERI